MLSMKVEDSLVCKETECIYRHDSSIKQTPSYTNSSLE